MDEIVVRSRLAADLDNCVAGLRLVHAADAYPMRWPADPIRWLTPLRLVRALVAECPLGTFAGHVAVQRVPEASQHEPLRLYLELSRLYVTPAARRRHVAGALVGEVRTWAARYRHVLTLNVTDGDRSPAVAFYESTGWRYTHTTVADWSTPDGRPVRLRHYKLDPLERS